MVRDHLLKEVRFGTPASVGGGGGGTSSIVSCLGCGDEGNVFGIAVISGGGHRSSCDCDVQQLDSFGLRQEAGQDGVPLPLLVGQSPSEVDGESLRPPRCVVVTRAVQCSGRSAQPSGSCYRDRVVSPPAGGERSASRLVLLVARLVRDAPQRKASPILFPRSGSPGGLRGCGSPTFSFC